MRKLELLLEKPFVLLNIGMQINRPDFTKKECLLARNTRLFFKIWQYYI